MAASLQPPNKCWLVQLNHRPNGETNQTWELIEMMIDVYRLRSPFFSVGPLDHPIFFTASSPIILNLFNPQVVFFCWVSSGDFYGLLFYCLNPQNLLDSPSLFSADDRERGRINGWRGGKFQRWVNPQAKRAGHGMGICGFFWVKNGICWDYTTAQSNC